MYLIELIKDELNKHVRLIFFQSTCFKVDELIMIQSAHFSNLVTLYAGFLHDYADREKSTTRHLTPYSSTAPA